MGVTFRYCSRCRDCFHEDCFSCCAYCYELLSDDERAHGYLCNDHDEEFYYELRGKWIRLCIRCNPDLVDKSLRKEKKERLKDLELDKCDTVDY